jgi:hypothetical protein
VIDLRSAVQSYGLEIAALGRLFYLPPLTLLVPPTLPRRCYLHISGPDLLCRRSSSGGELLNEGVPGLEESGGAFFLAVLFIIR